jgi:methylated-DNA-[protein]-cysteine S-methyltransferase
LENIVPVCTCSYPSPLGEILASAEQGALTGLWFEAQRHYPQGFESWETKPDEPVLKKLGEWLERYFEGSAEPFAGPLALRGTPFRREVWDLLLEIPYGETRSYGEMARMLGARHGIAKMAAQAVGQAVGHNPVSLVVPCHRVIGTQGSLTGYGGGLDKKLYLLKLEGSLPE